MNLYEKLDTDVKNALKAGDALKVSVLRMALATIKTLMIEKNLKSLDDNGVIEILQRHVKQHRESIDQFTRGGRADLADKEKAELKILEGYLPEQLGEEELAKIVKATIAEVGASTKKDTGKVMKAVMDKIKGKADGKAVSSIVQQVLK
ncbi:MAG: GatB/YqeY domain-containing protein [Candidatus Omnitrophica bacterium]|nr:GatB/YqeY domain-containing protein [Candidatus Omnitrophota bacterium]